jgi:excisionase family DNA binding protein
MSMRPGWSYQDADAREDSVMDRLLLRVEEAAEYLSLGRSKTYQLVATGELPVVRIGRSVRVPAAALRRWVEQQAEQSAPTTVA